MSDEHLPSPLDPAYCDAIHTALTHFLKCKEWSDIIKAVKRLQTVFESSRYTHLAFIPHKLLLSKRIAQSLSPSLPSGVHLNVLSLLDLIFKRIGPLVASDLHIYSIGLFPLPLHCSTAIKGQIAQLYTDHLVPLGSSILPSLPSILAALYPSIEEEGAEFYEEMFGLILSFRKSVGDVSFFTATWRTITSSPPARFAALEFIANQSKLIDDKSVLIADKILMAHAIENCLRSDNTLVQRSILDILISHFPLDSDFFSHSILISLFTAACTCLTKRELSITRRIWRWMLGESNDSFFFIENCKSVLIDTIKRMYTRSTVVDDVSMITQPYQVTEFLLSRQDIGSNILQEIVLDILEHLATYGFPTDPKTVYFNGDVDFSGRTAVIEHFTSLWSNLNVSIFWDKLSLLISLLISSEKVDGSASGRKYFDIIFRVLPALPVYCQDSASFDAFFNFVGKMAESFSNLPHLLPFETLIEVYDLFSFCFKLEEPVSLPESVKKMRNDVTFPPKIPPFIKKDHFYELPETSRTCNLESIQKLFSYYCLFARSCLGKYLGESCNSIFSKFQRQTFMKTLTNSLIYISGTFSPDFNWVELSSTVDLLQLLVDLGIQSNIFVDVAIKSLSCVITLQLSTPSIMTITSGKVNQIISTLWSFLCPKHVTHHHSVSSVLASLDRLFPTETSKILCENLNQSDITLCLDSISKFATLWNYSVIYPGVDFLFHQPLFLLFECVYSDHPKVRATAINWAISSCDSGSITSLLDPLLKILLEESSAITSSSHCFIRMVDFDQVNYAFMTLDHLVKRIPNLVKACLQCPISSKMLSLFKIQPFSEPLDLIIEKSLEYSNPDPSNYLELLLLLSLRFIDAINPSFFSISDCLTQFKSMHFAVELFSDVTTLFLRLNSDKVLRESKHDSKLLSSVTSLYKSLRPRAICFFEYASKFLFTEGLVVSVRLFCSILEVTEGFSNSSDKPDTRNEVIPSAQESIDLFTTELKSFIPTKTAKNHQRMSSIDGLPSGHFLGLSPFFEEELSSNDDLSDASTAESRSHSAELIDSQQGVELVPSPINIAPNDKKVSPRVTTSSPTPSPSTSSAYQQAMSLAKSLALVLGNVSDVAALRPLCSFAESVIPSAGAYVHIFSSAAVVGITWGLASIGKHSNVVSGGKTQILIESIRHVIDFILSNVANYIETPESSVLADTLTAPFRFVGGVVASMLPTTRTPDKLPLQNAREVVVKHLLKTLQYTVIIYGNVVEKQYDYLHLQLKIEAELLCRVFSRYCPTDFTSALSRLWFSFMSSKPITLKNFTESHSTLLTVQQKSLLYLISHEVLFKFAFMNKPEYLPFDVLITTISDTLVASRRGGLLSEGLNSFGTGIFEASVIKNNEDSGVMTEDSSPQTPSLPTPPTPSHNRSHSSTHILEDLSKTSLGTRAVELGFVHFAACVVISILNNLDQSAFKDIVDKCMTVALNPVDIPDITVSNSEQIDFNSFEFIHNSLSTLLTHFGSFVSLFTTGTTAASSVFIFYDAMSVLLSAVDHFGKKFKKENELISLLKPRDFFDSLSKIGALLASIGTKTFTFNTKLLAKYFDNVTEESIKVFFQVCAIQKLTKVVPLNLSTNILSDSSSAYTSTLLDKFMFKMLQEARNHSGFAIKFLIAIKDDPRASIFLKSKVLDCLNDDMFFYKNFSCISDWMVLINHCISEPFSSIAGDAAITQFVSALATVYPQKMMYLSTTSEARNRVGFLQRLAFIILSGEFNSFSFKVGAILERIMEIMTKYSKGFPAIISASLLCFRCLLARVSHHHLRSHWGSIFSEVIRIFTSQELPPTLILSLAKFLDILLVVSPEDLLFYQWIFFKDLLTSGNTNLENSLDSYRPFIKVIAEQLGLTEDQNFDCSVLQVRSPLISSPAIHDETEAQLLLSNIIPTITKHAVIECSVTRRPDYRAIDRSILFDFLDGESVSPPVTAYLEFKCFLSELYSREK
ncbi:hypothetical protein RCL1_000867 [Eukaryota sp. TZLM3-RCL]